MRMCSFPEEIMQLLKFELGKPPTWVITHNVCAIYKIQISRKSNCSLYFFQRREVC